MATFRLQSFIGSSDKISLDYEDDYCLLMEKIDCALHDLYDCDFLENKKIKFFSNQIYYEFYEDGIYAIIHEIRKPMCIHDFIVLICDLSLCVSIQSEQ